MAIVVLNLCFFMRFSTTIAIFWQLTMFIHPTVYIAIKGLYKHGALTKGNINKRGYNKFLSMHNLWHVEQAFRIAKSKIEIRPMFHFTRKRIEAHICICFVALKVYKELERMLKVSKIKMSVDKVLALAKTITTIQIKLPLNKEVYTQTMLMARHQKIAKLFDEEFWVTR